MKSQRHYAIYSELLRSITGVGGAIAKSRKGIQAGVIPINFKSLESALSYLEEVWKVVMIRKYSINSEWPKDHLQYADNFLDSVKELRTSYDWNCNEDVCFIFDASKENEFNIPDEIKDNCVVEVRVQGIEGEGVNMKIIINPDFDKRGGLIVAIIQDFETKEVLMQAYINQEAWQKTLQTNEGWFWSTEREALWKKGEESGNVMKVKEIWLDCDRDAVLLLVDILGDGVACHTKNRSCFFRKVKD